MQLNKAPGEDGIISEFYRIYWEIIKHDFLDMVKEVESENCFTDSQTKGVICLLYNQSDRDLVNKMAANNTS